MGTTQRFSIIVFLALACRHEPEPGQSTRDSETLVDSPAASSQRASTIVSSDSLLPPSDTLRARLCRNLNNSYQCAQAIERHLLADPVHGAHRLGSELVIPLLNGGTLSLRDSAPDMPTGVWYTYRTHLPSIRYHVVEVHYYEGGTYLLVNGRSGKKTFSNGLPVVSPDNRRVAAGNVDLEAEFSPTTVQVWRLEGDSLTLEWEHNFLASGAASDSTWGPGDVRWQTRTEIVLTKEYGFGQRRGESLVRLGPAGWAFSPP